MEIDTEKLSVGQLGELLRAQGATITDAQLSAWPIPKNPDSTIDLVHFTAWMLKDGPA